MIIQEIIDFLKRSLFPHSESDTLIVAIALFAFGVAFFWKPWQKSTLKKHIILGFINVLVPLLYFYTLVTFVPCFQSFEEDKFSILFANFSGARLDEHFGDKNFNEILERELQESLRTMGLNSVVLTRSISFSASMTDSLVGEELMERYNAYAIIYGEAIKLDKSINFKIYVDHGPLEFIVTLPNDKDVAISFRKIASHEYELEMSKGAFDLKSITKEITNDFLLLIAAHISPTNLSASEKIVMNIPGLKERDWTEPYEPFVKQLAAFAFARNADTLTAMDLYDIAYYQFQELLQGRNEPFKLDKILMEKLNQFAGAAKFNEGKLAVDMRDYPRAVDCFLKAARSDSAHAAIVGTFLEPIQKTK